MGGRTRKRVFPAVVAPFVLGALVLAVFVLLASNEEQAEAASSGAAMSLSINGQTGVVEVGYDAVFTVTVNADSIPLTNGYIAVQAWVDYGNTGITGKKSRLFPWPDCNPPFVFTILSVGNAEYTVCFTALGSQDPPRSYFKGPVISFDATCDSVSGSSHTIQLFSAGHPVATTSGTAYLDGNTTTIPAAHPGDFIADEIQVNCGPPNTATPTPTPTPTPKDPNADTDGDSDPNSSDPDDDNDGCTDVQELGADEALGGRRNPHNPWDFYDVAIGGAVAGQDGYIDLFNDIVGVINHYAPIGTEPAYDVNFDRGQSAGPNQWNMTAPDGKIDLFNDISGVIAQAFHDCR